MKVINVAGARPNFVKIASLVKAMKGVPAIDQVLVHTGQHYDQSMSEQFFDDLEIPRPDINLNVGSGSHAAQTAEIMKRFEPVAAEIRPDLVVLVGDVNSTLACALTAKKIGVDVAHVEAGLRSFDRTMPEEINRVVTDAIADLHFITEESALGNLQREGISPEKIFFVGNVMIDSLLAHREKAERSSIRTRLALNGDSDRYALVTLHRPSNVDEPAVLEGLLRTLDSLAARVAVVFPVHPRTQHSIEANGLRESLKSPGLRIVDPLGYLDFLHLMSHASLVITDSGGIQEETTVLGVPCLTVRHNTERPVTTEQGTNRLVGNDPRKLLEAALGILDGRRKNYTTPKFWDGRAAERIISVLLDQYGPADLRNRARGEPIAAGSNGQRFE